MRGFRGVLHRRPCGRRRREDSSDGGLAVWDGKMVGAEGFEPPGPLLPKQMRYQAALRPDWLDFTACMGRHPVLGKMKAMQISSKQSPKAVEQPAEHERRNQQQAGEGEGQRGKEEPALLPLAPRAWRGCVSGAHSSGDSLSTQCRRGCREPAPRRRATRCRH